MNLWVVLTHDISLNKWKVSGVLYRELKIYRTFLDLGHSVTFITYGDKSDHSVLQSIDSRFKAFPLYENNWRPRSKLIRLIQSIWLPVTLRKSSSKPTIVMSNQLWGAWVAILLGKILRSKVIVRCGFEKYQNTIRLDGVGFFQRYIIWLISFVCYWTSDKIIVTTDAIREFIKTYFFLPPAKVVVIPNYVDTREYSPINRLQRNGRLVFVGRISYAKNIDLLMRSVEGSSYKLDIIGDGEEFIRHKGLVENQYSSSTFLGKIDGKELPGILKHYSAFLLTSRFEGHPKALIEAMSSGLPCICTNAPGIREVIEDGVTGLLCDEEPNQISEAIDRLMASESLQDGLGNNARNYIIKNYDLLSVRDKYIEQFRMEEQKCHF